MAISKLGGTGSDNWELITSVTPTAASAAVNFTGLSLYKKFIIIANAVSLNANSSLSVRLNNDSGNNYINSWWSNFSDENDQNAFTSGITWGSNQAATHSGLLLINSCDNTGLKLFESGFAGTASESFANIYGCYLASAVVSQVNLVTTSTFGGTGTVYLYGVK